MEERKMFFDTYSEMLNDTIDGLKREDIQKLFDLIEETRNNGKHLFVLNKRCFISTVITKSAENCPVICR